MKLLLSIEKITKNILIKNVIYLLIVVQTQEIFK